ncbi:MAG: hypothetical protein K5634_02695 [Sphaerochaetaceae bacterium]|nr:hypothetical protein [Sphaerochaetaceae bacterium]
MKKALIILCILLIPATIFASGFGFRAGLAVKYDGNIGNISSVISGSETIQFPNDFGFGSDINVKFLFLDADLTSYFGSDSDSHTVIDGLLSLNGGVNIADLRLTAGLGVGYAYNFYSKELHFKSLPEGTAATFWDELKATPINLRFGADITFDKFNVALFSSYGTNLSLNSFKILEIFKDFNWRNMQVGVAFSYVFAK